LTVDTTSVPGSTLVNVGGELDMLTAPSLRETLFAQVGVADADVIVDLDEVTFMSSTALGVLVEVSQHAKEARSRLRLVCSNRTVLRPLELTGLDHAFEIVPSLD
jgi:anti-sigma B factor antagonist